MRKWIWKILEMWRCKCGAEWPDDKNFCMYCDREKPIR